MNAAQIRKYRAEWSHCIRHFESQGKSSDWIESERHNIHRRKLGKDKSSTKFTEDEFDEVIGAFKAIYDGGNLNAQIRQINQPEERARMCRARIDHLLPWIDAKPGLEYRYLQGFARNLFGHDQVQKLNDKEMARLEGVVIRRVHQIHSDEDAKKIIAESKKAQPIRLTAPPSTSSQYEEDENPFS